MVNGLPKRFCSQCSTFKHIADFNGKMRACRSCLTHRSANRTVKREFLNAFGANQNPHGGAAMPAAAAGGGQYNYTGQLNGQMASPDTVENAQFDAFMAGAALAEILRNNGNTEPVATAAAMAAAAAARASQQQQQQQNVGNAFPPPPRIISTTNPNTGLQQNPLRPTAPADLLQQESALAALLAAATTSAPTFPPALANLRVPPSYQTLLGTNNAANLTNNTAALLQQQQQQLPHQQQPSWTQPAFHSLVEMHQLQHTNPAAITAIHTTQGASFIEKDLELKRLRVLAELHLAKTNLELAQVEEDINKLRYRQQQQQAAAAAAAAAAAGNGGTGTGAQGNKRRRKSAEEEPNDQTPGTPKNMN
jgi:hypothetical protein